MKRIHRALTVLLAMLILTSGLIGCASKNAQRPLDNIVGMAGQQNNDELQQAKSKLLDAWLEVLETNEQIYSSIFCLLDHTDSFVEDHSWDSLLKARASSSAAVIAINQMELPVLELTEAEIGLLIDADIEINAVQREFEALAGLRSSKNDTASLFSYTLEDDVFMKASVEDAIPAMAAFYREYFTLEYRYLCQFTNYLLLQMDSVDMWALWKAQLPYLADCAGIWYDSTAELEGATGQLLDEMEALQSQMGSFQGTSEYTLGIVKEAVETGNLETLRREINEIIGVPGYFPVPYWLPDVLNLYLVTDTASQEKQLVKAGMQIDSTPTACYISCEGISLEDLEFYEELLKQWGIETYRTWNESKDTCQMLAESGNSTMMIEWTQDRTVLYLTEPVGCLIPELYLYAMTEE